jgi:hypothetical protein
MYFNDEINEVIHKLKDLDNIIFSGSIADYFNFKKYNIDINVSDIDILTHDFNNLTKIAKIFKIVPLYNENSHQQTILNTQCINTTQYYVPLNNTHIDIFLIKKEDYNKFTVNNTMLYDTIINYFNSYDRYNQLTETLNFWFKISPLTDKTLKYLEKKMLYKNIII